MRKIAFISIAFLIVFSSCSYQSGVSEAFMKYRFKEGVTTVSVPGWVIGLAANIGDLDESEKEILESIDKVRVIAIEDADLNARTDLHKEFYEQINRKGNYEELLVIREDSESVTVFGVMDEKESLIKELLVLVGGDDNALIYVKGEIRPELINDKINLKNTDKFLSLNFD